MGDLDEDGMINFREFLDYCVEHEKKLRLVFQAMDTNKDGELARLWVWPILCHVVSTLEVVSVNLM